MEPRNISNAEASLRIYAALYSRSLMQYFGGSQYIVQQSNPFMNVVLQGELNDVWINNVPDTGIPPDDQTVTLKLTFNYFPTEITDTLFVGYTSIQPSDMYEDGIRVNAKEETEVGPIIDRVATVSIPPLCTMNGNVSGMDRVQIILMAGRIFVFGGYINIHVNQGTGSTKPTWIKGYGARADDVKIVEGYVVAAPEYCGLEEDRVLAPGTKVLYNGANSTVFEQWDKWRIPVTYPAWMMPTFELLFPVCIVGVEKGAQTIRDEWNRFLSSDDLPLDNAGYRQVAANTPWLTSMASCGMNIQVF